MALTYRRFFSLDAPSPPGRRLSTSGTLSGTLHGGGYYAVQVCLGTPGRQYELIVDTGSSVTSVPCRRCTSCGAHRCGRRGRFDERTSSTAERITCTAHGALRCERCRSKSGADPCRYGVSYLEGSHIRGHVLRDAAMFRHASGTAAVRVHFGCQTSERGKFRSQNADGILGLQGAQTLIEPRPATAADASAIASHPPPPCGRLRSMLSGQPTITIPISLRRGFRRC